MDVPFPFLLSLCLWLEPRAPSCPLPAQAARAPAPLTWEAKKEQSRRQPHGPLSLAGVPGKSKSQPELRSLQRSLALTLYLFKAPVCPCAICFLIHLPAASLFEAFPRKRGREARGKSENRLDKPSPTGKIS